MSRNNRASKVVIWNPKSSRAEGATELRRQLEADPRFEFHETTSPDDAGKLARDAATRGDVELVVAAGGDGTINSVINGLCAGGQRNETTTLAILPVGTANDLARGLRVPLDPAEALTLVEQGRTQRIDLIRGQSPQADRLFANVASGGNSTRVSEAMTDDMKKQWGAWCYLRGAIAVLSDLKGYVARVQCDDEPPREHPMWNFIVANGTSVGGVVIAPAADPTDGLLDLIVVEEGTLLDMAQVVAGVVTQSYLEHEGVVHRQAKRVTIEVDPPTQTVADGEPIEGQPLTLTVVPGALNVIVGSDAT
jgi:diacylglycerol kinase (ATP)